jgi:predicted AlkP superfamily pyrophosphatase or phosphodiesterase
MSITRRNFLSAASYGITAGALTGLLYDACPQKDFHSRKVLLIGIDGLRPDALQKAATPNLDALVAEAAYSFAARTGEYTVSGPGWSNILTGVWEDKHGVKDNTFAGADYDKYPTIFSRIEKYNPNLKTASVASWEAINDIIITKADKRIYRPFEQNGDARVAKTAAKILANKKVDLLFTYFMGVDVAGHGHGFSPDVPEYISQIETIDKYVGKLMEALQRRSQHHREQWLTIVASDHGGKGKEHDGVGEEAKKVPLIMHSPFISHREILPIPHQVDITPTILYHLGIPIKSSLNLDGKVVK